MTRNNKTAWHFVSTHVINSSLMEKNTLGKVVTFYIGNSLKSVKYVSTDRIRSGKSSVKKGITLQTSPKGWNGVCMDRLYPPKIHTLKSLFWWGRIRQFTWGHWGGAPDGMRHLYEEEEIPDPLSLHLVGTWRVGGRLEARKMVPSRHWLCWHPDHMPPNSEINICSLNHPVCGILL